MSKSFKLRIKRILAPAYVKISPPIAKIRWRGKKRIFCLSFQKTGTSSVGAALSKLGYPVAGYAISKDRNWIGKYLERGLEGIASDPVFQSFQCFQDTPWWAPGIAEACAIKFPDALFVLMERDPEDWLRSIISHNNGRSLESRAFHYKAYKLERAGVDFSEMPTRPLLEFGEHYKSVYSDRHIQIRRFFAGSRSDRLFYARLEDPDKWRHLCDFLGEPQIKGDVHENKT